MLGGSSRTVSPGGYILGGGHSPITRTHGLGVDQVVAFTIVTENGTAIHVDPEGSPPPPSLDLLIEAHEIDCIVPVHRT